MNLDALMPVLLGSYMGLQGWQLYALVSMSTEIAKLKTVIDHLKERIAK